MPNTSPMVAEELGAVTSRVLKHDCLLKPNINREEARASKEFKQDNFGVIFLINKEVAMVGLDKQGYLKNHRTD